MRQLNQYLTILYENDAAIDLVAF